MAVGAFENIMILAATLAACLSYQSPRKLEKLEWILPHACVSVAAVGPYVCVQGGDEDNYLDFELLTGKGKHVRSMNKLGDYFVGGPTGFLYYSYGGRIHVVDQRDREVRQFGSYGKRADQFTKGGTIWWHDKDGPQYLAIGSKGDIYAYDEGSDSIKHFGAKGKYINTIGKDFLKKKSVSGLAVDSHDNVYVSCIPRDAVGAYVACLSRTGKVLRTFGSIGEGVGQFHVMRNGSDSPGPGALAIGPGDLVYVSDMAGVEVEVYASSGKPLKTLNIGEPQDASFIIYGLAVDKRGTLYGATTMGVFARKRR